MSEVHHTYTFVGFPGVYWEKKAERERNESWEEEVHKTEESTATKK